MTLIDGLRPALIQSRRGPKLSANWLRRRFAMRLDAIALAALAVVSLSACDVVKPAEYVPEVGYRQGSAEAWWIGGRYRTKEECASQAVARFNAINAESRGRAFSWACRVMRGEKFESRVR
jgi:hypothetical protein